MRRKEENYHLTVLFIWNGTHLDWYESQDGHGDRKKGQRSTFAWDKITTKLPKKKEKEGFNLYALTLSSNHMLSHK